MGGAGRRVEIVVFSFVGIRGSNESVSTSRLRRNVLLPATSRGKRIICVSVRDCQARRRPDGGT